MLFFKFNLSKCYKWMLRRCLYSPLLIFHAFTATKDYSPRCQFENFSHYGVKPIYL